MCRTLKCPECDAARGVEEADVLPKGSTPRRKECGSPGTKTCHPTVSWSEKPRAGTKCCPDCRKNHYLKTKSQNTEREREKGAKKIRKAPVQRRRSGEIKREARIPSIGNKRQSHRGRTRRGTKFRKTPVKDGTIGVERRKTRIPSISPKRRKSCGGRTRRGARKAMKSPPPPREWNT